MSGTPLGAKTPSAERPLADLQPRPSRRIGCPDPCRRIECPDPCRRIGCPDPSRRIGCPDPSRRIGVERARASPSARSATQALAFGQRGAPTPQGVAHRDGAGSKIARRALEARRALPATQRSARTRAWRMAHGAWRMAHGAWRTAHEHGARGHGARGRRVALAHGATKGRSTIAAARGSHGPLARQRGGRLEMRVRFRTSLVAPQRVADAKFAGNSQLDTPLFQKCEFDFGHPIELEGAPFGPSERTRRQGFATADTRYPIPDGRRPDGRCPDGGWPIPPMADGRCPPMADAPRWPMADGRCPMAHSLTRAQGVALLRSNPDI